MIQPNQLPDSLHLEILSDIGKDTVVDKARFINTIYIKLLGAGYRQSKHFCELCIVYYYERGWIKDGKITIEKQQLILK